MTTVILGKFPAYRIHQKQPNGFDRWGDEAWLFRYSLDTYKTREDAESALRLQTVRWSELDK